VSSAGADHDTRRGGANPVHEREGGAEEAAGDFRNGGVKAHSDAVIGQWRAHVESAQARHGRNLASARRHDLLASAAVRPGRSQRGAAGLAPRLGAGLRRAPVLPAGHPVAAVLSPMDPLLLALGLLLLLAPLGTLSLLGLLIASVLGARGARDALRRGILGGAIGAALGLIVLLANPAIGLPGWGNLAMLAACFLAAFAPTALWALWRLRAD
jgi:hypothetical protein